MNKKQKKKVKTELLDEWQDVYGVLDFYDISPQEETEVGEAFTEPISIGLQVYSLSTEQEEEILLTFHPTVICGIVENFLMEHHNVYISHLASRVNGTYYKE